MNRVLLGTAGAILAALTAQPAYAADPVTINCITDAIDASTRQALLDHGQNVVDGKLGVGIDPVVGAMLRATIKTCAEQSGWSDKAQSAALLYTLTKVGMPAFEGGVRADGFDVAVVEKVIWAMPPAQFSSLSHDPVSDAVSMALVEDLIRGHVALKTQKQARHIGILAAAISLIEAKKAEFAAS